MVFHARSKVNSCHKKKKKKKIKHGSVAGFMNYQSVVLVIGSTEEVDESRSCADNDDDDHDYNVFIAVND